ASTSPNCSAARTLAPPHSQQNRLSFRVRRRARASHRMSLHRRTASCRATEMICRSSSSSATSRKGGVPSCSGLSWLVSVLIVLARKATNPGAAGAQLLFQTFEAAVEMVDPANGRFALRDQSGDDQAHRGAQVRRHDLRALQTFNAPHPRLPAVNRNVCAETGQFRCMHKAVLEDV